MRQPDATPTRKISAATVGAAFATMVTLGLAAAGVDVPAGLEGAVATVVAFAVGYVVSERDEPNGAAHTERGAA